jgi:hypothetical protein
MIAKYVISACLILALSSLFPSPGTAEDTEKKAETNDLFKGADVVKGKIKSYDDVAKRITIITPDNKEMSYSFGLDPNLMVPGAKDLKRIDTTRFKKDQSVDLIIMKGVLVAAQTEEDKAALEKKRAEAKKDEPDSSNSKELVIEIK